MRGPTVVVLAPALLFAATIASADDRAEMLAAHRRGQQLAETDYAAAAQEFETALALAARVLPENHVTVSAILNDLGNLHLAAGQFAKAEPHYLRSLKVDEALFGRNHPEVGKSFNNMGILYKRAGDYAKAEGMYVRSLQIKEANFGANHPNVATAINNLAILYKTMGEYTKAEAMYLRCLRIDEAASGPNHPNVAVGLNNLANLYALRHQFAQAEPLYQRSLKIREAYYGPKHKDVAQSLNNLASLYKDIGRYEQAEDLFNRSLRIREAVLGPNASEVSDTLTNLAILYRATNRAAKAEPLYLRCLKIDEAIYGPDHPAVAVDCNNLAVLYANLDRIAEAEPLYRRSLKINEAKFGPLHSSVARDLNNLATLYMRKRDYAQAEPLLTRSLMIHETTLGADHPMVARYGLHNLGRLEAILGREQKAVECFEAERRILRRHIARVLPMLSDTEQLIFLEETDRECLNTALSLTLHAPGNAAIAEASAGWLANGKAVAFDSLAERAQLARDRRDPKAEKAAAKLLEVRTELATLTNSSPRAGEEDQRRTKLAQLAQAEQDLAKEIAAFRGEGSQDDPWITVAEIRAALPAGSLLLDFARLKPTAFDDKIDEASLEPRYVVWLVPAKDAGDVKVVDLGPAAAVDAAVAAYQKAIAVAQTGEDVAGEGEPAAEAKFAQALGEVAKRTLLPLEPHLRDAKELVLSPDAALWLVPWAALPLGDGKYAVERWGLRYVTAGREVALEKKRVSPVVAGPARVLANPAYDQGQAAALSAYGALLYPNNAVPTAPAADVNRPNFEDPFRRSASRLGRVGALPGTAEEAAMIAPKLKELTNAEPRLYLGPTAQEAILKFVRNPKVLALSTHGFFFAASETPAAPAGSAFINDAAAPKQGSRENPLLRCGLLFAGCNERDKYTDSRLGDGVLTGLEIVGLDLRGTELVVLSACETGLGQVNTGEGVAGLRQAFQLAGAQSVVSTLWQIPDRQSAILMNDFFTHLAAGQTKAEALRRAQLETIKTRREKFGAAHPLYWAAWTVTGN